MFYPTIIQHDTPARDSFWELNDVVAELNTNGLDNGISVH